MGLQIERRSLLWCIGSASMGFLMPRPIAGQEVFDRAVYVDLEAAVLYAIEGPSIVLVSRVVVGAEDTPTPSVASQITRVNFRPSWRPTPAMLKRGDYEDGVRPPGPDNPLGMASIHFIGGGLIYLHGTNQPDLFNATVRTLSSGCVRVERLAELIAWLLDWPESRTLGALNGSRTFSVRSLPVPLVIARPKDDPLLVLLGEAARTLET